MEFDRPISPAKRDGLLRRYLGDSSVAAYKLPDGAAVCLLRDTAAKGDVVMVARQKNGETYSATYSASRGRKFYLSEEISPVSGAPSTRDFDRRLQELDVAEKVEGEALIGELARLLDLDDQEGESLLQSYFGPRGVVFRSLYEPPIFLEPNEAEREAVRELLIGRSITLRYGADLEFENSLVIVNVSCREPSPPLSSNGLLTILFGPADDYTQDFNPTCFALKLQGESGEILEPDFEVIPESMTFAGVKEGQRYRFV